MRNSKTHKKKDNNENKTTEMNQKEAGPEQCHPRVGLTRPTEGCLPNNILAEVASSLHVSPNRSDIEKALKVEPNHEYSFVKALPFDETKKKDLIKQMCGARICQDIPCITTKLLGLSNLIPQLIIQDFLMVLINTIFEFTFINTSIKIIIY